MVKLWLARRNFDERGALWAANYRPALLLMVVTGLLATAGAHYTFGILSPARNYLRGIIAVVADRQPSPHTIALLGADEPFSHEVLSGAADYAGTKGLQVVFQEYYPVDTRDVSALLMQV